MVTSRDKVFLAMVAQSGLPLPVSEYRFHATRRWRFDFAWPDHMVAVEVEGGVYIGGRHSRGQGMVGDMEKYNTAAIAGWLVLRFTPRQLLQRETFDTLRRVLADGNQGYNHIVYDGTKTATNVQSS